MLEGRERRRADRRFLAVERLGGVEDERRRSSTGGAGRGGTSVVCTTPCTTTSVPGGGNARLAACGWAGVSVSVEGAEDSEDGSHNQILLEE